MGFAEWVYRAAAQLCDRRWSCVRAKCQVQPNLNRLGDESSSLIDSLRIEISALRNDRDRCRSRREQPTVGTQYERRPNALPPRQLLHGDQPNRSVRAVQMT